MDINIKEESEHDKAHNRHKDINIHILYDDEITALINSNGTGVKEKSCVTLSLKYGHANILSKKLSHVLNEFEVIK